MTTTDPRRVPHTGPGHASGDPGWCEGCAAAADRTEKEARAAPPTDPRARLNEIKARAEKAAQFGMYGQEASTLRGYNVPVLHEVLRADLPAMADALTAVLDLHPKKGRVLCGAMAEVPHRHGAEREPYPIRPVTCTLDQGHDGDHQDAICCWSFQRFTEAACYKSQKWADRSVCAHCGTPWPCADVRAITEHLPKEDDRG